MDLNRNENISPHFKWREFIRPEDPDPPEEIRKNLRVLALKLEKIRAMTGKPMTINSGWRTESHNRAVGGGSKSQHLLGKAADIPMISLSPVVIDWLWKYWHGGMGRYPWGIHLDTRPHSARWSED